MFIADLVSLEWDVLRLRRLRLSLIRGRGLERLKYVLDKELDYDLYSERFADCLAEMLQEEGQGENAQMLARKCARDEPGAHEKANAVLAGTKLNVDGILKVCAGPEGRRTRARILKARPGCRGDGQRASHQGWQEHGRFHGRGSRGKT